MDITTGRLRYTQFFMIGLLGIFLYIGIQSLTGGISQFENHLWGRNLLVSSFTETRLKLGDRVFSQALIGKEGWFEYTSERNLDDYQNAIETQPAVLKRTQENLWRFYKELQKRNITLILVIAPNKATIYPDKLPDEIQKLNPQSQLDVFAAYLQEHGPPVLVDLRPALQAGRTQQDVYYKTNTHWNAYGAFIGYTQIMKELSKTYPQLAPNRIEDFKITILPPYAHDTAQIIGANILEPGLSFTLKKKIKAPKGRLPTLLMYGDSFGIGLKPFMFPHFRKMTVIKLNPKDRHLLSLKKIDAIKPDIVIVEIVERSLSNYILDTFLKQVLSGKN